MQITINGPKGWFDAARRLDPNPDKGLLVYLGVSHWGLFALDDDQLPGLSKHLVDWYSDGPAWVMISAL